MALARRLTFLPLKKSCTVNQTEHSVSDASQVDSWSKYWIVSVFGFLLLLLFNHQNILKEKGPFNK